MLNPRIPLLVLVMLAGACRSSTQIREYVVGDPAPVATSALHSGPLPVQLRHLSLRPFLNREGIALLSDAASNGDAATKKMQRAQREFAKVAAVACAVCGDACEDPAGGTCDVCAAARDGGGSDG